MGPIMTMTFFTSGAEFRQWLDENFHKVTELNIGFYKKGSDKTGITYAEALDEALCFGWIDGLRKRIDDSSYMIRFTPRKARSIWSNVNSRRVEELKKLRRMTTAGLQAFAARDPRRSGVYAFENAGRKLDAVFEKKFRANKKAWKFFQEQAPWYQRTACWWVMSAKKAETRIRRFKRLMEDSERVRRLAHLTSPGKKPKQPLVE
jgi:uncharacterized protein YdeI (YjbR/CyaY-like superfamily)